MYKHLILLILSVLFINPKIMYAGKLTERWLKENYIKTEVLIKMRDGISLFTSIYQPKDSTQRHPVIMQRTPYSLSPYGKGFSKALKQYMYSFVKNNYIIVLQNVRGTYLSEGEYENIRPIKKTPDGIDEGTDVYDTAEWILKNTFCNGNIGVKGTSYPGFYATWAALSNHPAIKAVSPQAPIADWYMGDDVHHNGAFMLADMYRFGGSFFRPKNNPTIRSKSSLVKIDKNIYDFFLEKGDMLELMKPYGDSLDFWNKIKEHPNYDDFWKERSPLIHCRNVKPAVMVVAGTYDAEDCYGAFHTYRSIKKQSPNTPLYIVIGPWAHGAWKSKDYNHLDGAFFGNGSSTYFMENIEYPFFAYYLENKKNKPISNVNVLPSGDTQENTPKPEWKTMASWPNKKTKNIKFYLSSDCKIVSKGRSVKPGILSYISDPSNPVPYYHVLSNGRERDYMAGDQRFLDARKDILEFESGILEEKIGVGGPIKVVLNMICSTTDADVVVKVIDCRPDGYKMLVRADVLPLRYRKGFENPVPLKPGHLERVEFEMPDIAHIFYPNHKIIIQIQSSWYPLVAMNPQKFIENQYFANDKDYNKAKIDINIMKGRPSYIELPVTNLNDK
jgi:hypothetical protein